MTKNFTIQYEDMHNLSAVVDFNDEHMEPSYPGKPEGLHSYLAGMKGWSTIVTARQEGELVGNAIVREDASSAEIWCMAVRKDLRGYNIGKGIVKAIEDDARNANIPKVVATVPRAADGMIDLLMGRGYEIKGVNRHTNPLYDKYTLEKKL